MSGTQKDNVTYLYDNAFRLTRVAESGNITVYSYDANGNRSGLSTEYIINGVSYNPYTYYQYNDANLITYMSNYNGYFDDEAGFFLPLYIDEYTYSYNTDGNQRKIGNSLSDGYGFAEISQTDYSYDGAGRLIFENTTGNIYQGANYSYDAAGNRAYMCYVESMPIDYEYTYNKNNQLTSETFYFPYAPEERYTTNYTYDENGSQTGRYGYEASSYGYDSRNRQISYQKGNTSAAYTYRPDGLRASKSVTAWNGVITTTYFVWDRGNMVYEYNVTAPANGASYLYGIGLLARKTSAALDYYAFNAHGDVTRKGNPESYYTSAYQYDAFGNMVGYNIDYSDPFRYAGQYYDEETDTYYLRARYYNPRNGSFTQEDPIRAGLNWYTYCANNPTKYIDPSGLILQGANGQNAIDLLAYILILTGDDGYYIDEDDGITITHSRDGTITGGSAEGRSIIAEAVAYDEIVTVAFGVDISSTGFSGGVIWYSESGGVRSAIIQMDINATGNNLIAYLAHELKHANTWNRRRDGLIFLRQAGYTDAEFEEARWYFWSRNMEAIAITAENKVRKELGFGGLRTDIGPDLYGTWPREFSISTQTNSNGVRYYDIVHAITFEDLVKMIENAMYKIIFGKIDRKWLLSPS